MSKNVHINKRVLMSGTNHFTVEELNPYSNATEQPKPFLATQEHEAIRNALLDAGVEVIKVPEPAGCQDGVYTANWALCRGDIAVMSNLPNKRKNEEPYAEKVLSDLGFKIIHVPDNLEAQASSSWAFSQRGMERAVSKYSEVNTTGEKHAGAEEGSQIVGSAGNQADWSGPLRFSGQGDALPCGNLLFCGSTYRTDPKMHDFLAQELGFDVIGLQTVPALDKNGAPIINAITGWPDSFFYDLDLALAVINDDLIAYCPDAFTPNSQDVLRKLDIGKIEVTLQEAMHGFACNLVSTGQTVIMSANAPLLASQLENHGLKIITPEITELSKGGGYIRCTTLTLEN